MLMTTVFWLALAIPGFALARRLLPCPEQHGGLLGTLAISYLASFAALTPLSIGCYLVGAPVWLFTVGVGATILGGAYWITRQRDWPLLGKLCVGALGIELAILALDLLLGARLGTMLEGDAMSHLARIRFLVDHGFSNLDPFVAGEHFFVVYHTNLLHALHASCAQLLGGDHYQAWFSALPAAKLLIACGFFYLGWIVFEQRWCAWLAVLGVIAGNACVTFLPYPNKIAPLAMLPILFALVIQICRNPNWTLCAALGIGSLVLGQIHGLYVIFAVLVTLPLLTGATLLLAVKGRSSEASENQPTDWRPLAAGALAICVGLVFPAVSQLKTVKQEAPIAATAKANPDSLATLTKANEAPPAKSQTLITFDNGWVMKNPATGLGTRGGYRYFLLVAVALVLVTSTRRAPAGLFLIIIGTAAAILFVPPICTIVTNVLGRDWALARLEIVLRVGFLGLVPATVGWLLSTKPRPQWVHAVVSLALFTGMAWSEDTGGEYSWKRTWPQVQNGSKYEPFLTMSREGADFLKTAIPPGSTVLARQDEGMSLVSFFDCRLVAAERTGPGVNNLSERRADLREMLSPRTPWPRRSELLRKHQIRYFLPTSEQQAEWCKGHVASVKQRGGLVVLELALP